MPLPIWAHDQAYAIGSVHSVADPAKRLARQLSIVILVVKKIKKGEYVDFVDLQPKKPGIDDQPYSDLAKDGIIVVTESRHLKESKKVIQDVGKHS